MLTPEQITPGYYWVEVAGELSVVHYGRASRVTYMGSLELDDPSEVMETVRLPFSSV